MGSCEGARAQGQGAAPAHLPTRARAAQKD